MRCGEVKGQSFGTIIGWLVVAIGVWSLLVVAVVLN